MFAPGTISFHVIIPGAFVFTVNGTPLGLTSASPVTVTLPVANVNAFDVGEAVASAVTVIVPIPNVKGLAVTLTLAVPVMLKVPRPKVNGFAVKVSVTASAIIPTLPIVMVNAFLDTDTLTLLSGPDVANGNADIASNPKLIKFLKREQ